MTTIASSSPMSRTITPARVALVAVAVIVCVYAAPAWAQTIVTSSTQMPGKKVLDFAAKWILAPLGFIALIVSIAGAFFRPDAVKTAAWVCVICAILFFLINNADSVMKAFAG